MIVRLARLTDVSNILAFAKARLQGTNYAGFPFNAVIARRTVMQAMKDADSRVWVLERDGAIRGFLIGEVACMPFTHHTSATDIAFMADSRGDLLLDAFVRWCKLRKVARIDMGVSATSKRKATVDRLYARLGFEQAGGMYYANLLVDEQKEKAA